MTYRTTSLGILIVALAVVIFSTTRTKPQDPAVTRKGATATEGRDLVDAPASIAALGIGRTNFLPKEWDGRKPQEIATREVEGLRDIFQDGARKRLGNGTVFMGGSPRRSSLSLDTKEEK